MKTSSVFALFAVVLICQLFTVQSVELDEDMKKECLKISRKTLKTMLKNFNICNKKLKIHELSGEEYQKRIGCVVKCVMESVNLLDDKGMMTPDTLKAAIEAHIPAVYVAPAHEILVKCLSDNKLDPADANCKSYLDMGTCMQSAVADACGEPPLI